MFPAIRFTQRLFPRDLSFFMRGVRPAPTAKLLHLDLPFHLLLVLVGIVITAFANVAFEAYEIVGVFDFGHFGQNLETRN